MKRAVILREVQQELELNSYREGKNCLVNHSILKPPLHGLGNLEQVGVFL